MTSFAVEVENLTIKFGDFTAVDHISFAVKTGEIFGFLGANGAGKTTTIRMLCGLLLPTEGHARIAGLEFKDGAENIKKKVGYMSQRFTLYNDLTVHENLEFTSQLRKLPADYLESRVKTLFEFIGFDHPTSTLVRDLPGGLKQELSLVAAMLHDPDIIFLDEPTAGVSPSNRKRFWELIRQLSASGKTVFVTTHYMDEAEECHRIALMRAGQIIAIDTPAGLKQKTFPEPLYELDPAASAPEAWLEDVKKNSCVLQVQPYGRRYHAVISNESQWKNDAARLYPYLRNRPIAPSLEDVFIRLVEGQNR